MSRYRCGDCSAISDTSEAPVWQEEVAEEEREACQQCRAAADLLYHCPECAALTCEACAHVGEYEGAPVFSRRAQGERDYA